VINTATNAVVRTINGLDFPSLLAVAPGGGRVYVANNSSPGKLSVIDTASYSVATIQAGVYPVGVAVSPNGARVYVTNPESDEVSVINTATNA
jgi:YVTN family beta-propeller protein